MTKISGNFCIRCGKLRIEIRTWKEHTKGGIVTHTTTRCPDPDCQKIINQQFANLKIKREAIEEQKLQRAIAAKIARTQKAIS